MALTPVSRQVGPAETAPLPMASADAFGASVGRGIADLGQSRDRLDLINKQVEANEQSAAGAKAIGEYQIKLAEATQDARANAAPGAAGYAETMAEWREKNGANLLDGVTNQRVRTRLEAHLAAINGDAAIADHGFVIGKRAAKLSSDETQAQQSSYALIRGAGSLAEAQPIIQRELTAADARIDGYSGISDDAKAGMKRAAAQHAQLALAELGIDTDPARIRALADAGGFDALTPSQIESVYRGVGVAERRQAAVAAHQAALDKADAREKIALVNARLEAGEDVPDDELTDAARLAGAIGDDSGAYKLSVAQARADINRSTQDWLPRQYDARIAELRAEGTKRSAAEDIELDQLEKIAPQRTAEVRHDPAQWAAANGRPAPAIDFNDPATLAARRQWAQGVTQATGLPTPLLTANERADLTAQAAASPQGRLDVIDTIAAITPIDARQAVNTAHHVLPGDALAAHLVLLDRGNRASAVRGAEARKADRSLIDDKKADGSGTAARESYDTNVAPALRLIDPRQAAAVYDIAGNMYADWAVRSGVHTFNEAQFDTFLQVALGARRDSAGVFHGGVGYYDDQPVLLPSALSNAQFADHLDHMTWGKNSPNAPVFRDGSAMTPAQVRHYTPVQRADGRYEFHGPGDLVLHDRKGGVWTIAIDAKGVRR